MKLVQILARELKEWPEGAYAAVQDNDIDKTIWYLEEGHKEIRHSGEEWVFESWFEILISEPSRLATDHATAIVNRADWEAEKARIAGKVDGGWKRHRGGKCPVVAGTRVSTKHRDGTITPVHHLTADPMARDVSLKTAWAHRKYRYDIMYYKPAEQPAPVSEPKGEVFTGTVESASGPLEWRDRIHELDSMRAEVEEVYQRQVSEIVKERGELVGKLAGEGLALVEVAVQPVEDMSDPANWRKGDLVECCTDRWQGIYECGDQYEVIQASPLCIADDCGGADSYCFISEENAKHFKWHSRPGK